MSWFNRLRQSGAAAANAIARTAAPRVLAVKTALTPATVKRRAAITRSKPLYEQFQRIGGGLTPQQVSDIIRAADAGQPARLIDLGNECRQKDGHLQCVTGIRDGGVALCGVNFLAPHDATPDEQKAADLCRRAYEEFQNWPVLVKHLTGSYFTGHATAQLHWEETPDRLILPRRASTIHPRDFIFSLSDGRLRYARWEGDTEGVDILAENPGRIVQIQRRINGDVQVREGLIRVLVWAALFRNWNVRDWLALAETAWKPWRLAKYSAKNRKDEDVSDLLDLLDRIGNVGAGAYPDDVEISIQWPQGSAPGMGGASSHQQFLEWVGREMSKAVLGQTTSTEPGMNGDRSATETRDKIRAEIREDDALAVAAVLREQMFTPIVRLNIGDHVRVPAVVFDTQNAENLHEFATAIAALTKANVRLPAKWIRDEIGCPEPLEGEEVVGLDGLVQRGLVPNPAEAAKLQADENEGE